jgi:hypothetical protein
MRIIPPEQSIGKPPGTMHITFQKRPSSFNRFINLGAENSFDLPKKIGTKI